MTVISFGLFILFLTGFHIKPIKCAARLVDSTDEEIGCRKILHELTEVFLKSEDHMFDDVGELDEYLNHDNVAKKVDSGEVKCPNGMKCIKRNQRERGKYFGCYKDEVEQRMFRGYTLNDKSNLTIAGCVSACHVHRFIYAGLQGGDWCHCGNMIPNSIIHQKLPDNKCNYKCTGNSEEICGANSAMAVFETGIEEYRFDASGNVIESSNPLSKETWKMATNC